MLGLVVAPFGGLQKDAEVLFDGLLPDVFRPRIRTKRLVERARAFFYDLLVFVGHKLAYLGPIGPKEGALTFVLYMLHCLPVFILKTGSRFSQRL